MKNPKIVLVAEWDGWCGACAADRPLVLTRTGRSSLRSWLAGAAVDSRPLVLTCRLCGTGVDVPHEQDDPPVVLDLDEADPATATVPRLVEPSFEPVRLAASPSTSLSESAPATVAELTAGRQAFAQALGRLLAQRGTAAPVPSVQQPVPPSGAIPVLPAATVPAAASALPVQRSASSGGLAELQLLADGIDLLSTGRA